jgi:hypothetical protein
MRILLPLCCSLLALGLGPLATAADLVKAKTDIALDDIGRSIVKGHLGETLGSKLVIEGTLSDRLMPRALQVSAIGRKTLKEPITIEIRGDAKLEKGRQYRLEGYESGGYESTPAWALDGQAAQRNFAFYSFFIVTKVLNR